MSKPLIVIAGRHGQLGQELVQASVAYDDAFIFLFAGRYELDLGKPETITAFFEKHQPAYFINCAAYTAVDKAEAEQEAAYTINAESVGMIAQQCHKYGCIFVTISTDYVFDGKCTRPYQINDATDPVNYYGFTKWVGEKLALENNNKTIVIRTSWLYSTRGNNFVKTILRLMKEKTELTVVSDQIGCPTYSADLADAILKIITSLEKGNNHYGIYQYSNSGAISWFDFAVAIGDIAKLSCQVIPVPTSAYPTAAKRPAYSVMDTSQIAKTYGIDIKDWKESLEDCIAKISHAK